VVLVLWKHRNRVFLMSEKRLDAGRKLQSPNSNGGSLFIARDLECCRMSNVS